MASLRIVALSCLAAKLVLQPAALRFALLPKHARR